MANLDVIYKISADISGLQTGVDRAAKATEGLQTAASRVGTAIAGAFTVTAVAEFGRTIISAASDIQKFADRTGLATDEVQKLQFIAGQSDVSVEGLVGAVQNLQQRLGDENAGTVGALAKLNIHLDDFKRLSAYEQMTTLAESVRQIKDPTEQAAVAAALFGKTWKEILPAIKSGMKDVGDQAPIMADATIKALDRIDDTLKKAQQQGKAWAGDLVLAIEGAGFAFGDFLSKFNPEHFGIATSQILKIQGALNDPDGLKNALGQASKAAGQLAKDGLEPLKAILPPTRAELVDMNRETERTVEATRKAWEEQQKLIETQKRFIQSVDDATVHMNLSIFALHRFGAIELPNVKSSLEGVDTEIHNLNSRALPDFHTNLSKIGQRGKQLGEETHAWKDSLDALSSSFTRLAQVSDGAFSGIAKAIGVVIASLHTAMTAVDQMSDHVTKDGKLIKASFADVATGLVSLIGLGYQFAQTLADIIPGDAPWMKAIKHIEDTLKAIQDAKDAAAAAFTEQQNALETLDATAKKYGFTLEELGPALQRQDLDKQAQQLYKDFKVLTAGGIETGAVVTRMADATNAYIHDALKMGVEVPAAMKPMLQRMADMGLLTDENGNVISDLTASGIKFSETMTEGFNRVVEEVKKLTDAISRGLGLAISNIPRNIDIKGTVTYDTQISPGGTGPWNDFPTKNGEVVEPAFASVGGTITPRGLIPRYFDRGGTMLPSISLPSSLFVPRGDDRFPAMLAAGETVRTKEQEAALWNGPNDGGDILVKSYVMLDGQVVGESVVQRIGRDKRGLKTKARRALGVG